MLEIVKAFEEVSGVSVPIEIAPRRPGDLPSSYASCHLAERELNWKSQFDLKDMCELGMNMNTVFRKSKLFISF